MYRTVKHEAFISGPMGYKSVLDLPGIGEVRGGRLKSAGITYASQLASLYERMGRSEFELFLNSTCGQNVRYTGMTIDALDECKLLQFATDPTAAQGVSCETVIAVKKPMKISAYSNLAQVAEACKSESINDHLLTELSTKIASLQLNVQKLEENIKEFSSRTTFESDKLIELPGTVEFLKWRIDDCAKTNGGLGDKIHSNQRKIIELNENIHLNGGELMELTGKIETLQLLLRQTKDNCLLNKETILREHDHLTKFYETLKWLQLRNVNYAYAIKGLLGKINSIEDQLVKENIGLRKDVASKNDELENLVGKMDKFEFQIKKMEENNSKLNTKLIVMYCFNFLIVFTFLFFDP